MAVKDSYSRSRATKKNNGVNLSANISNKGTKKAIKSIKKSPFLIIAVLFLIIGAVVGYFAFNFLSSFEMNQFLINGVASNEKDYIIVDVSLIKEEMLKTNEDATMQEIYESINLEDKHVTCKFFGMDINDTVTVKYYYREDISHNINEVSGVDLQTAGVYYIEYTSSHFAFKNKTLIRTVIVTEVENDG